MSFGDDVWEYTVAGAILAGFLAAIGAVIFIGILIGIAVFADGCGYSAKGSEMIGQVKSVSMETPLLCPDRVEADLSLGILRSGSGSMSKHDVDALVPNKKHLEIMRTAAEDGRLVRVTYDKRRMPWCGPDIIVTRVDFLDEPPPKAEVP